MEEDLIVYTVEVDNLPVVMRTIFDEMTKDSNLDYSEQTVDNAVEVFKEVFPLNENEDYEFTLETMTQLVYKVLAEEELLRDVGVAPDGTIEFID